MTDLKVTNIPHRQRCINKEHPYVAGARDIYDDKKEKSQEQVNKDVDDTFENHQEQINNEKQRAEGVEGGLNTRLETVEQLAQISIGGGDAQIATASDFTNPDATKRAKIPTVGAIVDGLNDGVYDVSKRNPTAGPNSDGKFTLDYILSNADTLIPIGWRHGGMTISFVQSSDNNYVKFFCTADEFTTDVTKWQGVDDEPSAGSQNLVKSGGVEKSIREKSFLINVNLLNNKVDEYSSSIEARQSVPTSLRKEGLVIVYKLSSGWYVDQQIGYNNPSWSNDSNWSYLNPIDIIANVGHSYSDWQPNTAYSVGDKRAADDANWECITAHTSASVWGVAEAVNWKSVDNSGNSALTVGGVSIGEFSGAYKSIKLAAFTTDQSTLNNGDYYYNPNRKQIRKRVDATTSTVIPYVDGALYIYEDFLYVWDGSDLTLSGGGMFINVNILNNKQDAYSDAQTARNYLPVNLRKCGTIITYLLDDGWHTEQFTGTSISPWGSATTWKGIDISIFKNERESLTDWQPNTTYVVGDKRQVNGANWECIEAHTSLSAWNAIEWSYWKSYNNSGNDIIRDVNGVLSKECGADKLIELKSIVGNAFANVEIGDVFYYREKKQIRRKISNSDVELIPFYQGAIYTYNGKLYIWNGTDLVPINNAEVIDNPEYKEVYVDSLKRVVFGLTTDGETYIPQEVVTKSEESVESEGIEPYFEDELEDTISSVLALRTEPCLVFPVITDVHYRFPDINPLYFKHGIENMKAFLKQVKCDFVVNLGDSSDGRAPKVTQVEWSNYQAREYAKLGLPMYFVPGNHELNIYTWNGFYDGSEQLTEEEIYTLYYNCMPNDVVHNPNHYHDYYKDIDAFNIRVVGLDFSNGSPYKVGDDTVSWARDVAFDTDKMVLLFTHYCCIPNHNAYPTVYTDANYAALTTVIESFISGGGTVVNITGHSHSDFSFATPWLQISLNNQRCQKADIYTEAYDYLRANTDIESPNRIYGAESEDCWSVFVLRPFSRKIDYIRFGAGNNKSFTY